MTKKLSQDDIAYLAAYDDATPTEPEFPECNEPAPDTDQNGWWPKLGATQLRVFNSEKKYVLAAGERGSGKSFSAIHKVVRHVYSNWDALAMMTSLTITAQTAGGIWTDLCEYVLPEWEEAIGLKFIGPRMDSARNAYVKVGNVYGGWSTIILKSIPSESVISQRFKGTTPSLILLDEICEVSSISYMKKLGQQLGRKRGIKVQQFICTANPSPEGEDHWVYQSFIKEPTDPKEYEYWKEHYDHFHVPISENLWLPNREKYIADLKHMARTDPTEYDRIVLGKWTKQMVGQGIFKDYFMEKVHVKGDASKGIRFVAQPGIPITVGYDIGEVNQGIAFLQQVPMKDKTTWVQLDELVTIGKKISLQMFVRMILGRLNEVIMRGAECKGLTVQQARQQFYVEHISDNSSMRFRAVGGDLEKNIIEELSAAELRENPEMYPYVTDPIVMLPAPKGDGSVEQRSRLLIDLLQNNRYLVDSGCKNSIDMFMNITAKKNSIFAPDGRSKYKHILDGITYPLITYIVNGTPPPRAERVEPMVY